MSEQELTFEQAAMILGVTRQTVYNWAEGSASPFEVVLARIKKCEKEIQRIKQGLAHFQIATPAASGEFHG